MIQLLLPKALGARIEAEARAAFPRECCGLIEGIWSGETAQALVLHPALNIATAADRFEIEPGGHFTALKAARGRGHELIGCYHSHPGGVAEPSGLDLAGGGETGFLWLIAALAGPAAQLELKGFAYLPAGFDKIGVVTGADLVTSSP